MIIKGDEDDEDVDIVGMDSFGSMHHAYDESQHSFDESRYEHQNEETSRQLLLDDLQHSEGSEEENDSDDEDDFVFDDGDDEDDFEMEDEDINASTQDGAAKDEADEEELEEDDEFS